MPRSNRPACSPMGYMKHSKNKRFCNLVSKYLISATQKTRAVSKDNTCESLHIYVQKYRNPTSWWWHTLLVRVIVYANKLKSVRKTTGMQSHPLDSNKILWLIKAKAALRINSPALDKKPGSFARCCCWLCCCILLQMSRRFLEETCNLNGIVSKGESVQSHLLRLSINVKENKASVYSWLWFFDQEDGEVKIIDCVFVLTLEKNKIAPTGQ